MIIRCNKIISVVTHKDLGDESPFLVKGKDYVVFALDFSSKSGLHVYIQTENFNEPSFMPLDGFEMLSQKIPSNWIFVTDDPNGIKRSIMLPAPWNYDDFFEDISEEVPSAVELYHEEVRKIYQEEGLLNEENK